MVPDTVSLPHDQHTCKSAFTHRHTHTRKYKLQHLASNSLRNFLNSRHVTFREHPCQVCVCVCVCVSMLNNGHCNCQPCDITNCTERSGREAAGREYTESDLSITFLMAISDGGAGVVVCARAHGVSASASTIDTCKTRSDGALLGPEARIWPRSGVTWLSRAPCSSRPRLSLAVAVSEPQSERREIRTW
jgi:hypothetical protein